MTVTFNRATRGNIGLLLMVAGGTGSGKTWSAMELAKGMALGKRFAVCDTERGRAAIYADSFDFDSFELAAPFTPERYLEVVLAAEAAGYPVLVIDSQSHEWEGPGGLLDQHEQLMGGQQSKNLSAWIKPKMAHRAFVSRTLQAKPHIIMCFRAAERVEVVQEGGKQKIVKKQSLTGLDGWMPITEKNLPFEATASFMLMADKPGFPHAIKLPDPLKPLIPLDRPLSEQTGAALAKWAAGDSATVTPAQLGELTAELLKLADERGVGDKALQAVERHQNQSKASPAEHADWLRGQIARMRSKQEAAA
jgi:hypothetical protein